MGCQARSASCSPFARSAELFRELTAQQIALFDEWFTEADVASNKAIPLLDLSLMSVSSLGDCVEGGPFSSAEVLTDFVSSRTSARLCVLGDFGAGKTCLAYWTVKLSSLS